MKRKKILSWTAMPLAIVAFSYNTGAAQPADAALMSSLAASKKIIAQKDVLADFAAGEEETKVMVLVKPLSAAETKKIGKNFSLQSETGKKNARAAAAAAIKAVVDQLDPSQIKKVKKFSYVNGFAATVTPEGLQELTENPDVISVEKDYKLFRKTTQGIPQMNASTVRNTYGGAGVSIAVIDDGVDYMHPDLGGAALPASGGSNNKVIGGRDMVGLDISSPVEDDDPMPDADPTKGISGNSHGTSCAGIAAGNVPAGGGGQGDYIGGVAPQAKIYALKVFDAAGGGSSSFSIKALEWAVTNKDLNPSNPILIASMSLGTNTHYTSPCDGDDSAYKIAVDKAIAAGITVFAASGNENNKSGMGSPACISEVISVGAVYDANIGSAGFGNCTDATTAADQVTCYSNSASFLDLLAPSHNAATPSASGGSATYSSDFGGTSAATPYAAGAAAVLQSAAKSKLGRYLTPHEVKMYLTAKGDPITDSANNITTPRVNLGNADAVLDNCGLGRNLPANTFLMTAPSCVPNPADMGSQYNALGTYNTNWRAWTWNADPGGQNYVTNAASDVLVPGVGNWIYSTNAASPLKLAAASGTFPATSSCSTYDATLLGDCFVINLNPSSTDIWQIVGYPFASPLAWADVRVAKSTDGGTSWTVYTPSQAETATPSLMLKTFWRYSGSAYESYDDVTTGMIGTLQPQGSFWVRIKSGSSSLSSGNFKLLIPKK